MNEELIFEIAHEAHSMGRVYTKDGERRNPADEFNRVEEMVRRKLKNSSTTEISRDNEIKMQMAKDIYCHVLNSWDGEDLCHDSAVKNADAACNIAEFIFNRFNK